MCLHLFLILEAGISARSPHKKLSTTYNLIIKKIYCSINEVDITVDITDKETKAKSEKLNNLKVTQLTNGRETEFETRYI